MRVDVQTGSTLRSGLAGLATCGLEADEVDEAGEGD
jgi:hypothetical protein